MLFKRLGTALCKLAKEERLGGCGSGHLTEAKCDKLQAFYRQAFVENTSNIENMRNAIGTSLWHSISTDNESQHRQCPKGKNSWCFYQRALAHNEKVPSHKVHPSSTYLTAQVAHKLIPVYKRMADEELLKRMLHGGTQNNNKCFNSMLWSRCPFHCNAQTRRLFHITLWWGFPLTQQFFSPYPDILLFQSSKIAS